MRAGRTRSVLRFALLAAVAMALLAGLRSRAARLLIDRLIDAFAALGPSSIPLFAAAYAIAAILFLPGSALTIGAGIVYGLLWGSVAVSCGATLGAAGAFLVARYLARSRVERWAAKSPRFAAIDAAVGREGWKIVLLTRLSPVFPYNLLNYLYGLTQVRFGPYVLASWIGMIPGTILYVYLGFAGREVARAASGRTDRPLGRYLFWGIGLLATLLVTLYVTRLARRALRERAPEPPG